MKIHLWPESPRCRGGRRRLEARVEGLPEAPDTVWFELPETSPSERSASADPFLLLIAFSAMRHGRDVHVHGRVSPTLLTGLEEVQAAWRHTRGQLRRRRQPLTAGIMVHGFDIPWRDAATFDRAAAKARGMLTSIGLEFTPVVCNVRDFRDDWPDSHGLALAAVLHLFRRVCVACVATALCFAVEGRPQPSSLPVGPLADAVRRIPLHTAAVPGRPAGPGTRSRGQPPGASRIQPTDIVEDVVEVAAGLTSSHRVEVRRL